MELTVEKFRKLSPIEQKQYLQNIKEKQQQKQKDVKIIENIVRGNKDSILKENRGE